MVLFSESFTTGVHTVDGPILAVEVEEGTDEEKEQHNEKVEAHYLDRNVTFGYNQTMIDVKSSAK